MSTIIQDTSLVLPGSPSNGQLFFQIGVGPMLFYSGTWHALQQIDVDFLTILANNQNTTTLQTAIASVTTGVTINQSGGSESGGSGGSGSGGSVSNDFSNSFNLALDPLVAALTTQSAALVRSTDDIAGFVKALAVITEYWKQISEVRTERYTKNLSTLAIDEPLVHDHAIVPAHNSAQTTIQS